MERLTNGLHDELWINGARALPEIAAILENHKQALKAANAIECIKELHKLGVMNDTEYKTALIGFLEISGFKYTE